MSEQNIVNVMVIPDVPKVLPGEQLYVYVPKASFTFPGIIAYNNTQFRIDGNFLFIREDYVSPGVQQKIDELKQYTDDELQLKQDKEDNNISLAQRPEQKSVVGAINDLGTLTGQAQATADDAIRKIGDLSNLTTDEKTTIVGAINEVDAHADANKSEIGNLSVLTTDEKATLVGAINEVDAHTNTAQQAADAAQATADNATTLANTGISKADRAQTTANTAVDKANDAKATAQEAIMKADGRSTSIGFMTAKDAVTALNGYPRTQLKGGDTIWIVEDGTPDLWVTDVAQESVPYNYTTKDKFNQDLVDNKVLQIGYFKTAYQESDGKPVTIAWQNVLVKSTDWVASTEFADFPYEAKIELTDFVDYTTVPQVVFDIADTMSGNYAPICKSGDKCVYIYGKVQDEITLKTVITFAPNVNGASVVGCGYNNRGQWQASTTYEINDLVYTDNRQFVCIEGITSTTSPEQDTQHWQATFVANVPVTSVNGQTGAVTIEVPTKTSDLQNDSNFATTSDIPTKTSQLTNDSGFITSNDIPDAPDAPTALPQEAVAVKSGSLPTTGWTIAAMPLWEGDHYSAPDEGSYQLLPAGSINFDLVSKVDNTKWFVSIDGDYSATQDVLSIGTAIYVRKSNSSSIYYLIKSDGSLYCNTSGSTRVHFYGIKNAEYGKFAYGISDSSITVNSDVLMELTDSEVKSYSMEAGKITVIRDTVPTSPIPYTYKVKQTNASGQFTLVNHYVPESPTDLPVTYKKASGELPTTGWSPLGWEQSTLPAARHWSGIAYGKGKFVTIAGNGSDKGAYSADGINWTEMTMPSAELWNGIAYGNGKFVAVATSTDKGAYSVDGINWTLTTMPSSPGYKDWIGVAYGNGKFVTLTLESSYCAYSNDGITWTATTLPTKRNWRRIAYGNDKFVAIAKGTDKGAYSTDGVTWTEMTLPASRNWQGITYGEDKFIAIAGSSDKGAYSTDGINWTEMTLPESRDWYCTAYGDGKFVAIEYNGLRAAYSTDGITWLSINTPIIRSWYGVVYGDNKFVVVSRDASVSSQNNKALYWEVDSKFTYTISDTFITTNTSVKMYLTDEGGVKALRRANGSITVLRSMVPTTVIPYEYEVKQTSTSGLFEVINAYVPDVPTKTSELTNDSGFLTTADIPTKTSQLTNDSGFVKASEANTFTGVQTFSNADGIKTDRVHNLDNNDAWYNFDGSNNRFGSPSRPTIIRTSEARPRAQVPSGETTVTKEIALLEDIPSAGEWVTVTGEATTLTQAGTYQFVTTAEKVQSIMYWDGTTSAVGIPVVALNVNNSSPEVITLTPVVDTDGRLIIHKKTLIKENNAWVVKGSAISTGFKYRKIN